MPGMLSQIERRLAQKQEDVKMLEKDTQDVKTASKAPKAEGEKIVAISVDAEMYEQLVQAAKRHGVRGVRGALMLAAKTGLRHL